MVLSLSIRKIIRALKNSHYDDGGGVDDDDEEVDDDDDDDGDDGDADFADHGFTRYFTLPVVDLVMAWFLAEISDDYQVHSARVYSKQFCVVWLQTESGNSYTRCSHTFICVVWLQAESGISYTRSLTREFVLSGCRQSVAIAILGAVIRLFVLYGRTHRVALAIPGASHVYLCCLVAHTEWQ